MGLTPQHPVRTRARRPGLNPLAWFMRWADWFESKGVYIPGEDSRTLSPWRDFGWLIAVFLLAVSAFIVLFAIVS